MPFPERVDLGFGNELPAARLLKSFADRMASLVVERDNRVAHSRNGFVHRLCHLTIAG
jgi:hypothetical protein